MKISRRNFIRNSVLTGGVLLFPPWPAHAQSHKREEWRPAYEKLESDGTLAQRVKQAYSIFDRCELCPRRCGANRSKGEKGFCRAPAKPMVYGVHPHFGEEMSLVGEHGSGTIFFSNCNLRCVFCQNWTISHEGKGEQVEDEDLADMMIGLQKAGCHNVNLVTPTHVMPNILNATRIALKKGLRLPLVYNTSGYERLEIVRLLDGIVDIYMPDLKYMDREQAAKYSAGAADYPEVTKRAIVEMHRQVGELKTDRQGIALRGLIIRHLVMPNQVAGSEQFVKWVAGTLPRSTYVNIMAQYRPAYRAREYPAISRATSPEEFLQAMAWAEQYGLTNLDPHSVAARNAYRRSKR
jgi:putative pyruvate formate lyase activating enzyme